MHTYFMLLSLSLYLFLALNPAQCVRYGERKALRIVMYKCAICIHVCCLTRLEALSHTLMKIPI